MVSIKISLDKRARKQDGTFPLVMVVSHQSRTARIPLGISLPVEMWDNKKCRIVVHPQRNQLQAIIDDKLSSARLALLSIPKKEINRTTATQLRDRLAQAIDPEDEKAVTFGAWYEHFANSHDNPRTRAIYLDTLHLIKMYDPTAYDADFTHITKSWLDSFFATLAHRSPSVNARNIHLRNIRAVLNDAIDNELTTHYPFRRFRIKPAPTIKRSIPIDEFRSLFTIHVEPHRQKYIDAFRISFFLIGCNMADLLQFTPDNVQDGRLRYIRHKTHRLYDIAIPTEARAIIERYKGKRLLLSFAENCADYRHFANRTNINLHEIRKGLTMYWARHTWATIAASLDIPDDVISLALGHTPRNTTTDIYIRRDLAKVDAANRRVIDYVLKCPKT